MNINTDLSTDQRLFVGEGTPELLGRGDELIPGSAYIQGPAIIGSDNAFEEIEQYESATLMISETNNEKIKATPFYSLIVKTYAKIKGYLKVDELLSAKNILAKTIYTEILSANVKNFRIQHPLDPEKYLIHSCLEGPENAVYIRGRIKNDTIIKLPNYWEKLIDKNTITVSLQPIGVFQNLIVKRITSREIYIQSGSTVPIDCYYHIFAERIDVDKLNVEIEK